MTTPIESLRFQIETFLTEQLDAYKAQLPGKRSGTGRPIQQQTIAHRERGAEDFVLFLLGKTPKTERIRNVVKTGRVR